MSYELLRNFTSFCVFRFLSPRSFHVNMKAAQSYCLAASVGSPPTLAAKLLADEIKFYLYMLSDGFPSYLWWCSISRCTEQMEKGFNFFISIRSTLQVQTSTFPFSLSFLLLALKLSSIAKHKLRPGDKMHIESAFNRNTLAKEPH